MDTPPAQTPATNYRDPGEDDQPWLTPQMWGDEWAHDIAPFSPEPPLDILPPTLANYVDGIARSVQVPPTLPLLGCLTVLSIIVGPKLTVTARPGFIEPLTLATLTALPPGSRKSPAFRPLKASLKAVEQDMRRAFESQRTRLANQLGDEADTLNGAASVRAAKRLKALEELAGARLLAENTTPEALEKLAAANGGIINFLDSEGTALGNLAGRYNNGIPNLEFVLKSYDCDDYHIDRVSREHRYIERACMSMGLTTQPEVLHQLHAPKTGMRERGFLGRVICTIPKPTDDHNVNAPTLDPQVQDDWEQLLYRLHSGIPMPRVHQPLISAGLVGDGPEQPATMRLSDPARGVYETFEQHMHQLKHSQTGPLAYMADWVGKHYGRTLRLAALLHVAAGNTPAHFISAPTMQAATELGYWTLRCAQVVYGRWHDPASTELADQLATVRDWWLRAGSPQRFRLRDVMRGLAGKRWVRSIADVREPMRYLTHLGWWRMAVVSPGQAGRPTEWVVANPGLHAMLTAPVAYRDARVLADVGALAPVGSGTVLRVAEVTMLLNACDQAQVWDTILGLPDYDEDATEAADPDGLGDRVVLTSGHVLRWSAQSGQWLLERG